METNKGARNSPLCVLEQEIHEREEEEENGDAEKIAGGVRRDLKKDEEEERKKKRIKEWELSQEKKCGRHTMIIAERKLMWRREGGTKELERKLSPYAPTCTWERGRESREQGREGDEGGREKWRGRWSGKEEHARERWRNERWRRREKTLPLKRAQERKGEREREGRMEENFFRSLPLMHAHAHTRERGRESRGHKNFLPSSLPFVRTHNRARERGSMSAHVCIWGRGRKNFLPSFPP